MLPNTLAYQQNYIKSIRRDFRQRKVSLVHNLQCREKCMTACADLIPELPSMGLICFTNEFNQHKPQPHLLYSTHSSPSPLHFSHPCGSWSPAALQPPTIREHENAMMAILIVSIHSNLYSLSGFLT